MEQEILALLREHGPIGWYGIEIRLRVPRSAFKDGYTLMTYLDEMISAGSVVRTTVDGEERFVIVEPSSKTGASFLRCGWKHTHPDEPILLYSELDADRRETRKVEVFRDGTCGWADASEEVGGTRLGAVPVPPIEEIAQDAEFSPALITREEFEEVWAKRRERRRA